MKEIYGRRSYQACYLQRYNIAEVNFFNIVYFHNSKTQIIQLI